MSVSQVILATLAALLVSTPAISAQAFGQTSGQLEAQLGSSSPLGSPVAPATPRPSQSGASALTVRYESGKLTVAAHGVSLQGVLQLIAQRTGTVIESTGWSDAGQVYVELGPATVQEVLTDLLNGSPANYVMLGSQSNPGFVERLIISAQAPSGASSQAPVVAAAQPVPKPQVYGGGGLATDPNGSNAASVTAEEEREPPSTALPPVQNIDSSMAKFQEAYAAAAASGKSRSEILQELQRQQIQQLAAQAAQEAQSAPH